MSSIVASIVATAAGLAVAAEQGAQRLVDQLTPAHLDTITTSIGTVEGLVEKLAADVTPEQKVDAVIQTAAVLDPALAPLAGPAEAVTHLLFGLLAKWKAAAAAPAPAPAPVAAEADYPPANPTQHQIADYPAH